MVTARHKMAGALAPTRLIKQLPIGTRRLKAVVLNDDSLSPDKR
jgi:hypothetical protein